MKLSIIVPVYNAGMYISNCLDSLLDQGLSKDEYEIIVVNDGSTDNSLSVISRYKKRFSCIKVVSQENAGQLVARNTGIESASGDYLCFVDADDFLIRKRLSRITEIAFLQNLDIVTYGMLSATEKSVKEKLEHVSDDFGQSNLLNGIDYIAKYNYNNGPWYYLVKRSFLQKIKLQFIPGRKCEDGIFTMQLFLASERMMHINVSVYCYLIRENSTVTSKNMEHLRIMIDDFQFAIKKLTEVIDEYKGRMSPGCFTRCMCRRDSYVFFLLVRIMKFGMDIRSIRWIICSLKEQKAYPFNIDYDYGRRDLKILYRLFNIPILYYLICLSYRIIK